MTHIENIPVSKDFYYQIAWYYTRATGFYIYENDILDVKAAWVIESKEDDNDKLMRISSKVHITINCGTFNVQDTLHGPSAVGTHGNEDGGDWEYTYDGDEMASLIIHKWEYNNETIDAIFDSCKYGSNN